MKLLRFDRPFLGAWWGRVFGQPPMGEVPERPTEVATAVQPVFDFLGSSKHVSKSIWNASGAGGAFPGVANPAIPSTSLAAYLGTALPVPADEIWVCDRITWWHDDVVGQWAHPILVFPDNNGWVLLGEKKSAAGGTAMTWDTRFVVPAGWKIGVLCNGPLGGGKMHYFQFPYVPLKIGETLNP